MNEAMTEADETAFVDSVRRLRGAAGNGGTNHASRQQLSAPWPELHSKALHGLAGEIVNVIKPETESDPVAVLIQKLVCFGNVIGRNAYYRIEDTDHHANIFACLVGATSRARKGTSEGRVRAIMRQVEPEWEDQRIKTGLSSGEGFINEVRDELKKWNIKESVSITRGSNAAMLSMTRELGAGDGHLDRARTPVRCLSS